jgi:DNA-binding Xre family transcriptional regulator
MLKFNLKRVLAIRNVANGMKFLKDNDFTPFSATSLYNYYVSSIKIKNLERLCLLLNCTPNDFFEWKTTEGEEPLPEAHALNSLRREKSAEINKLMKSLPLEKLSEVEDFIKNMKE